MEGSVQFSTLTSSCTHLDSLKVQLPREKVTAMEWPTKVAGTFEPAGRGGATGGWGGGGGVGG